MTRTFDISENLYTAMHKCTRCGQCTYGKEEAGFDLLCPMYKKAKFFTYSAGGMMQLARFLYEGKIEFSESLRDILYLCTTCGACELNCGVIQSQVDLFTLLKKGCLKNGIGLTEAHGQLVANTVTRKAPYGGRLPERDGWMPDTLREKISSRPDIFYFVGCVSAYRETEIPEAFVSILNKLDIPFAVSHEEWCCGAPLYFSGHEEDAVEMARHNAELIEKIGASTAVMTCPTCSMVFREYYPRWLKRGLDFDVFHATEFLEGLQKEGRLNLTSLKEFKTAVYHDPCHLGRGQGVYEAPRGIIRNIEGLEFKEAPHSGENSLCCGGGGLLPAGFPELSDELARERAREMKEAGADILVSSCPACKENLKIAAKGAKLKTKILDLIELVDQSLP